MSRQFLYDLEEQGKDARQMINDIRDTWKLLGAVMEYMERHKPTDPHDDIYLLLRDAVGTQRLVLGYMLEGRDRQG